MADSKQAAVAKKPRYAVHGVQDAIDQGRIQPRTEICAKCSQTHLRCSGHAHPWDAEGNHLPIRPCRSWPMHGQSVCQTHGGKGRNRKAASQQWERERKMAGEMERLDRALKTFGLPIQTTPQQALLDEIYRTAGHVKWLGDRIAELEPEAAVWGKISEEHKEGTDVGIAENGAAIDLTTTVHGARPAVVYQLYQSERAHLVHVSKVAIQCNISERQVKIAEEQGHMIANAFRELIESPELALSALQIAAARAMASRVLRSMSMTRPPVAFQILENGA